MTQPKSKITILVDDPKGPTEAELVPKKKGGRPKNSNYLPWNECKEAVRAEMLTSKGQFDKWWNRNKPGAIPRFPYRVYTQPGEWSGWSEFLGSNNEFGKRPNSTNWRTLLESTRFVHTLKLKSGAEWLEYCRSGECPADIPHHPEITYKDWISWPNFLGKTQAEVIEVVKELQKTQVYYITHEIGVPENVFTFGVDPLGIAGIKDRYSRGTIHIMKLFWYDKEKGALIKQAVDTLSSPYMGQNNQRIVPNIYQIIEVIQFHLDTINRV